MRLAEQMTNHHVASCGCSKSSLLIWNDVANKNVTSSINAWSCLCQLPGLLEPLAKGSTLTGQSQRNAVGHTCSIGIVVRPVILACWIGDAAVMRYRRLVGRSRPNIVERCHEASCTWWRRACTWFCPAHSASAARSVGATTSLGRIHLSTTDYTSCSIHLITHNSGVTENHSV